MNCYRFAIKDRDSGILVKEWFLASDSLHKKDFHKIITSLYLWQRLLCCNWVACGIYRNGKFYTDIVALRYVNGLYIMCDLQTIRVIHM